MKQHRAGDTWSLTVPAVDIFVDGDGTVLDNADIELNSSLFDMSARKICDFVIGWVDVERTAFYLRYTDTSGWQATQLQYNVRYTLADGRSWTLPAESIQVLPRLS